MPPIQIPELSANEVQNPQPIQGITEHPIDVVTPMAQQTNALENLGKEAIKYRNEIKNQQADNIATEQSNKMEQQYYLKMYGNPETGQIGFKDLAGDPAVNAKEFDSQMDDVYKKLTSAPDGQSWDQETQNLVNRRVNRKMQEVQLNYLYQYGNQKKKYDDNVTNTAVDLNSQGVSDAMSTLKAGDESTLGPINQRIESIQNAIIAKGLRDKTAMYTGPAINPDGTPGAVPAGEGIPYDNPDGTPGRVVLGDTTKLAVKEALSNALGKGIKNLVDSNATDEAKYALQNYGQYMTADQKASLTKAMRSADVDDQAAKMAQDMEGKSPEEMREMVDNADDPKVAQKALQFRDDMDRRLQNEKVRMQNTNFQALFSQIVKQKQQDPDMTISDVEQTKAYKAMVANISPTQQRALENAVQPPKTSNPAALERVQKFLQNPDGNDLTKTAPEQLAQITSGLGTDRLGKFYSTLALKAVNPSTTQQNQQYRQGMTELKNQAFNLQAFNLQYIKPDNDFKTGVAVGGPEARKLSDLQSEYAQHLATSGEMTPAQLREDAKKFITDKLQQIRNQPGFLSRLFSGSPASKSVAATPNAAAPPMTAAQAKGLAIQAFQKTSPNHRSPNSAELTTFMQTTKGPWSQ